MLLLASVGFGCDQAFSRCDEQGLLVICCVGFSRSDCSCCGVQALVVRVHRPEISRTSVIVALGLRRSEPCGIFPDQGLNPCLLCWQADSYPLDHQGNPAQILTIKFGIKSLLWQIWTVVTFGGGKRMWQRGTSRCWLGSVSWSRFCFLRAFVDWENQVNALLIMRAPLHHVS